MILPGLPASAGAIGKSGKTEASSIAASVRGAWYEPPVLTLSSTELVSNGDFSNGTTGWTVTAGNGTLAVVNGEFEVTCGSGGIIASNPISTVTGKLYYISLKARRDTFPGPLQVGTGPSSTSTPNNPIFLPDTSNSTYSGVFIAEGTTTYVLIRFGVIQPGTTAYFDNISVREFIDGITDTLTEDNGTDILFEG